MSDYSSPEARAARRARVAQMTPEAKAAGVDEEYRRTHSPVIRYSNTRRDGQVEVLHIDDAARDGSGPVEGRHIATLTLDALFGWTVESPVDAISPSVESLSGATFRKTLDAVGRAYVAAWKNGEVAR